MKGIHLIEGKNAAYFTGYRLNWKINCGFIPYLYYIMLFFFPSWEIHIIIYLKVIMRLIINKRQGHDLLQSYFMKNNVATKAKDL